jgi:hypothetical protein
MREPERDAINLFDRVELIKGLNCSAGVGLAFARAGSPDARATLPGTPSPARSVDAGVGDTGVVPRLMDIGLRFRDRGLHELKGVPGPWHLYALGEPGASSDAVGGEDSSGRNGNRE